MRTCGECSLCCKLMGVDEIQKPAYSWCRHACGSAGCGIYAQRPQACRDFQCLWLKNEGVPEELRPDKSKAVLCVSQDGKVIVWMDRGYSDAWRKGRLGAFLNSLAGQGITVCIEPDKIAMCVRMEQVEEIQKLTHIE